MTAQQDQLVIVGGGMVGVALACALAPSGLRIRVLEQHSATAQSLLEALPSLQQQGYDSRVSALTCASQQLLMHLGAWSAVPQWRAAPYVGMHVWDGRGRGEITFNADALHEPCLGHIVENRVILAALYARMLSHENIHFTPGVKLERISAPDAQGVRQLHLHGGEVVTAPLLVAADGAQSLTRQLCGIGSYEWDYGHHALVTTVTTRGSHQWQCWQRFTEDGPLAFLPLPAADAHTSSIVWSTSPEHARALMAMTQDEFAQALEQAFERRLGEVLSVAPRQSINLRQRHAQRYVDPGLALIGDAAHTIHPLAGQGVNLGFLDVAALAEVLLDAHAQGEELADLRVLRRFQRLRRSDNLRMSASMELFRRVFGDTPVWLGLLRSAGMNGVNRLAPLKNHLAAMAMGLNTELPRLCRRPPSAF